MAPDLLLKFLGWNTLVHYAILMLWWLLLLAIKDWVYRLHSRWFELTPQQFDAFHYGGIGLYKLLIFVFFLCPYLVLRALS